MTKLIALDTEIFYAKSQVMDFKEKYLNQSKICIYTKLTEQCNFHI
jgi:hypothetical protein